MHSAYPVRISRGGISSAPPPSLPGYRPGRGGGMVEARGNAQNPRRPVPAEEGRRLPRGMRPHFTGRSMPCARSSSSSVKHTVNGHDGQRLPAAAPAVATKKVTEGDSNQLPRQAASGTAPAFFLAALMASSIVAALCFGKNLAFTFSQHAFTYIFCTISFLHSTESCIGKSSRFFHSKKKISESSKFSLRNLLDSETIMPCTRLRPLPGNAIHH